MLEGGRERVIREGDLGARIRVVWGCERARKVGGAV